MTYACMDKAPCRPEADTNALKAQVQAVQTQQKQTLGNSPGPQLLLPTFVKVAG